MRVLIIEDEKNLRDDVMDYLSENGYKCDFASSVKSSMQKLNDIVYSCALVDVGLPDGSGIEVVEHIKKTYPYLYSMSAFMLIFKHRCCQHIIILK